MENNLDLESHIWKPFHICGPGDPISVWPGVPRGPTCFGRDPGGFWLLRGGFNLHSPKDIRLVTQGPKDFVPIEGKHFWMGSDRHYQEEAPLVEREVADFLICRSPVTNSDFNAFATETGYVTTAEQELDESEFPDVSHLDTSPGSLVFTPTAGPVDLRNWKLWWRWVEGANWRAPYGPETNIHGKELHPVVHVSFEDAQAYCAWSDSRLPTETEWELAARGGLDQATYAWGDDLKPSGNLMANTWQGRFPFENTGAMGWKGTSPVGAFPANGLGLFDMIGNVWEWTVSPWKANHSVSEGCECSPQGSGAAFGMVVKGGSHLCAPEYCERYRPAARSRQTPDSSTTHLGFRVARSC